MKRGKDVESIMKRVEEERKKNRYNLKKRENKAKVKSVPVDTNDRRRNRRRTKERTKGRI